MYQSQTPPGYKVNRRNVIKMLLVHLIVMAATLNGSSMATGSAPSKFKAAVYAHAAFIPHDVTPVSREEALQVMVRNIQVYKKQAEEASKQDVDIIVFPEDGLYGMMFNRDTVYPYLEFVPDPNSVDWIPCEDSQRYKDIEVQVYLSCMAKQYQLYLVANIGDKQPCNTSQDPSCPSDGRYQYNTDVAYGPDGKFLAKYHKYNLFYEEQFNKPDPKPVFFDTPFGRFGMITCFDIIFKQPVISLVEEFNVTNIAFPTAWMDALPLFPAIGFHSSFARAHGVNFLSANIHLPEFRFDGSGLYAPDGARAFHYSSTLSGQGSPKLVIADMDVILPGMTHTNRPSMEPTHDANPIKNDSPGLEFQSSLFGDTYTFVALIKPSGIVKACHGRTCCELSYTTDASTFKETELFALGAFDGLHTLEGSYYIQNCALVKCADAKNKSSCGSSTVNSTTVFTQVSLRGQFQTPYVYPQLIRSDSQGNLSVSEPGAWTFTGSAIETSSSFRGSLLSAMLVARDYGKDDGSQ
ncbi:hypothetical protein EGW08_000512, partial [Elysia chlorotica]